MSEPLSPSTPASTPTSNGRPSRDPRTADLPLSSHDVDGASDREQPPGTPRWVKLFGIGGIVLLLVFAGMHLTGHGGGPAMHEMPFHSVMLP